MTIGEKIKQARLEKELSQRGLGKLISKPHSAICKIENNVQAVRMNDLQEIARGLNVSIVSLLNIPTDELIEELKRRGEFDAIL